jgi:anti-sigma regulatory factor (Ser/Thr protein kinase)
LIEVPDVPPGRRYASGALMHQRHDLKGDASTMALSADPVSIPQARRFVAERIGDLHDAELNNTLVLLVSEIVTNAILHSPAPTSLCVSRRGRCVRVEVADRGEKPPRMFDALDLLKPSGRGLQIVDRLATRWGHDALPAGGKVVWFELDV